MKPSLSLLVVLLALWGPGSAGATSCAGNSSFLESVKWHRDHNSSGRIVRARVVPSDLPASPSDPNWKTYMFETLEFLDGGKREEIGTKLLGNGVLYYRLNLPPVGRSEPLPEGSEWILQTWGEGRSMQPSLCSAILEVRGDTVHGLIQNPPGSPPTWRSRALSEAGNNDASQSMPLAEFRRALGKLTGGRKAR
ncbi:hypothetical protein [Variovorax sp. KBW07]|uniref:hypothetical protein n=1 Tax=Variovorax sp. KBW07 TaxID=2153358 RepID=UPI000F5839C1|nr:hypothetical protein [Variovorax sp. KBW07]